MPAGGGAGGGHDLLYTAAHEGDRAGRLVIGFGRKEAKEADFPVHPPLGVIFLHADIVALDAAVHAAWQGGLGDDEWHRRLQEIPDLAGQNQGFAVAAEHVEIFVAQNAEIGALHHERLGRLHPALSIGFEIIFAGTEKNEMIA